MLFYTMRRQLHISDVTPDRPRTRQRIAEQESSDSRQTIQCVPRKLTPCGANAGVPFDQADSVQRSYTARVAFQVPITSLTPPGRSNFN